MATARLKEPLHGEAALDRALRLSRCQSRPPAGTRRGAHLAHPIESLGVVGHNLEHLLAVEQRLLFLPNPQLRRHDVELHRREALADERLLLVRRVRVEEQ
eukprot:3185353-Prymnesium_polylepis.1